MLARAISGIPGRIGSRLVSGGGDRGRGRRYLLSWGLAILGSWAVASAYVLLMPKTYTSAFVLVLPGPGAVSSLNLASVGSATSTNNSVFSSPDLSPTENYRRLLLSHRLSEEAAGSLGVPSDGFPYPRVDLIDQTKIMTVSMGARTADMAVARAEAVRTSFLGLLEKLRHDEIQQRDQTNRGILDEYEASLKKARERLLSHQASTGLVSAEQYNTMVDSLQKMREQQREAEMRIAQGAAEEAELSKVLGVTTGQATLSMVLRGDPVFQSLLDAMAKGDAEIAILEGIRGQTNPRLQDAAAERASLLAKLSRRGAELAGGARVDVQRLRDAGLRDERARLMERLISRVAENRSLEAGRDTLAAQAVAERARVVSLAADASTLENLKRDVLVTEAVFTSALARIDTNKSDFFASYPMVQTLEPPVRPTKPSSPQPLLAFGAAAAASVLVTFALALVWLRIALIKRVLRPSPPASAGTP